MSISREAIANFLAAANAGGYLNFNGTFDVYDTKLFVNGSVQNTSVVFPAGGIHAHMEVHEVLMFLHIHCDAYTGFKIFDVALSHVKEVRAVPRVVFFVGGFLCSSTTGWLSPSCCCVPLLFWRHFANGRERTIRPLRTPCARPCGVMSLGCCAVSLTCLLYTSPSPRDRG